MMGVGGDKSEVASAVVAGVVVTNRFSLITRLKLLIETIVTVNVLQIGLRYVIGTIAHQAKYILQTD